MDALILPVDLGFASIVAGGVAPYARLSIVNDTRNSLICSTVLEGLVATEGTTARSGQVMIHPANRPFSEVSDRAGVHEWIALRFETFHPIWSTLTIGSVGDLADPGLTTLAFTRLTQLLGSASMSRQSEAFFAYLAQVEPSVAKGTYGHVSRFQPIVRYIDQNLHQDLSRSKLASLAGMHPNSFDRAFRAETGLSSQEFVRRFRLARAKRLIRSSSNTLDAVAFAIGLSGGAYFSRWFKSETGQSPTQYRESVNKTSIGTIETYFGE
jgi:AraC-like DNA-binding protein